MSDYIFSSEQQEEGRLASILSSLYLETPPETEEFHGAWGSLAVSAGHYQGFQPYEDENNLLVVIGGPVLYFRDNSFLVGSRSSEGTEAIFRKWICDADIQWDEDLSGPFTILYVNKSIGTVAVITDLMAFIPVYLCQKAEQIYLATHVDALANAAEERFQFDQVSLADFVLNDVVTYPYTAYERVRQVAPSSETVFSRPITTPEVRSYWVPSETNSFEDINSAAEALREGITGYVNRVTEDMTKVAQFISAGEDSRSLTGILPERLERVAFVFLDSMNREGRIAKRVADLYGAKFNVGYRSTTHYLNILPEATRLVGSGHQYTHAHSLGFDKTFKLAEYPAVFGGYMSDSLLKAAFTYKVKNISRRMPFFPEFYLKGEARTKPLVSPIIDKNVLSEVNRRRVARFKDVRSERPITAHEWFVLRPATMRTAIPNLYTTRRLFRSYEPFMCKEAVKVSAAVPTEWKLNRRLFNRTMRPFLRKSKWLLHSDGRLPYFSWMVNIPVQGVVWSFQQLGQRSGFVKNHQGPWADWRAVAKSHEWSEIVRRCQSSNISVDFLSDKTTVEQVLKDDRLPVKTRVNLLQIIFPGIAKGRSTAGNKESEDRI